MKPCSQAQPEQIYSEPRLICRAIFICINKN